MHVWITAQDNEPYSVNFYFLFRLGDAKWPQRYEEMQIGHKQI